MTREEAIDVLRHTIAYESNLANAIDVAIEALSAQTEEVIPHRNYKYLSDY